MNKIPSELYAVISSFLKNSTDMIHLKQVSKNFNEEIKKIHIQIIKLEELLLLHNKRSNRLICVNEFCRGTPDIKILYYSMGITTFYYPKQEKHAYNVIAREKECLKSPYIKRFIPYCFECIQKHVEYGKINDDPWTVPFGKNEPEYFI